MEHISLTIDDGIADVVMQRPKVNAMNRALLSELRDAFLQINGDGDVKGALIRAEGKAFSAGLDLVEVAGLDPESASDFLDLMEEAFRLPFIFPKPLAVATHGHAIAGGMVLSLTADFWALKEGDYKVGLTELQVGVPFPRTAFEIVRNGLPPRAFRKLVNEADTHPPQEIWDMGVADALVADPVEACRAWLGKITSRPLDTFVFVKAQRRKDAWERIAHATQAERRALVATLLATRQTMMNR